MASTKPIPASALGIPRETLQIRGLTRRSSLVHSLLLVLAQGRGGRCLERGWGSYQRESSMLLSHSPCPLPCSCWYKGMVAVVAAVPAHQCAGCNPLVPLDVRSPALRADFTWQGGCQFFVLHGRTFGLEPAMGLHTQVVYRVRLRKFTEYTSNDLPRRMDCFLDHIPVSLSITCILCTK